MVALAKGLALLALIGPALAIGLIGKSAMEAIGLNPSGVIFVFQLI